MNFIKYPGGKSYLAKWIISHFPKNYQELTYIEPFLGGGSVLLNKEPSKVELASDLDIELIFLWNTLKLRPGWLYKRLSKINYTEENFNRATREEFDIATRKYVYHRMSRGAMGKHFAWSARLRGGKPGDLNAWNNAVSNIPKLSNRIKKVSFQIKSAQRVLKENLDSPNNCYYIDPPYLHSTRTSTNLYKSEMGKIDHENLLDLIKKIKGKVIISGYNSIEYNSVLKDWRKEEREMANHSGQNKIKNRRKEVLWMNY